MRAAILLALWLLAGCSQGPTSGVNPHTAVAWRASSVETIDWRYPARLEVRAVRLGLGDHEELALLTFVTRSDLNYPHIEGVWSFGRQLPYEPLDRRRVGYERQESGTLRLTRAAFEAASTEGLTLQMIGRRGSYGGHVPARLFAEALAR